MKNGDTPNREPDDNWNDEDGMREAFAALSDDPLEWAEHQAEIDDYGDGGPGGLPE